MSLDIYLYDPKDIERGKHECPDCGHEHEYTRHPAVFESNITHNLTKMADEAGIYHAIWYPEKINITHARQLIEPLEIGLNRLLTNPVHFRQFDPENGWGSYQTFVIWVEEYLQACKRYPDAEVKAHR